MILQAAYAVLKHSTKLSGVMNELRGRVLKGLSEGPSNLVIPQTGELGCMYMGLYRKEK